MPDTDPLADGHTVIVPTRHVSTIYELTIIEQAALWALVSGVRARLLTGLMPEGFSIGFNDVEHGGADHAVVHVVPRQRGDTPGLPSGIEWVTDIYTLHK